MAVPSTEAYIPQWLYSSTQAYIPLCLYPVHGFIYSCIQYRGSILQWIYTSTTSIFHHGCIQYIGLYSTLAVYQYKCLYSTMAICSTEASMQPWLYPKQRLLFHHKEASIPQWLYTSTDAYIPPRLYVVQGLYSTMTVCSTGPIFHHGCM